jgi:hypothetical protein
MLKVVAGIRRVFGLYHPGRNLAVFPDDTFLISYPKSGNTWTRFLVANLVYPETTADFSNINQLTPDPEALTKRELLRARRPRFLKSHQYFDPRYPRVIYVVRDPRDVALSQFHFHRKRRLIDDCYPIETFVTRFIAGKTNNYGSWGENVASWLSTRHGRPGFLLLRYEDMLEDAVRELMKVAAFLDLPADPERIKRAVDRSSASEMRRMEKEQALLWSSTSQTRQDVPFVRSAQSGGWRSGLPEPATAQIEGAWSHLMTYLHYDLRFPERSTILDASSVEAIVAGVAR